jgi:hypothetical protein
MRFVLPVFQCRLAQTSRVESGQERRGAAAQIGGGYIGNVTTPEASLSREGICGSVDSRGSLAGRNRNLALQLRGSAGLTPAFPARISRHTTRLPRQVNRRLEADQAIWNLEPHPRRRRGLSDYGSITT